MAYSSSAFDVNRIPPLFQRAGHWVRFPIRLRHPCCLSPGCPGARYTPAPALHHRRAEPSAPEQRSAGHFVHTIEAGHQRR
jgi:hypothetical protein